MKLANKVIANLEEAKKKKPLKFKDVKKLLGKFKKPKGFKKSKSAFDRNIFKKGIKKVAKFFSGLFKGKKLTEDADAKMEALAKHLGIEKSEIEDGGYALEADGGEYMVLTDSEAEEQLKDYIRETIWAFNLSFLNGYITVADAISHLGLSSEYEDDEGEIQEIEDEDEVFFLNMGQSFEEWMQEQQEKAEGANDTFLAMIDDFDGFVSDAESADGRGHFLSGYDGEEHEVNDFYIYRVN